MPHDPKGNFNQAHSYLDVGHGHHIFWQEYGNPNGTPLLLVHGSSGFTFEMDELPVFTNSDRRVIVVHQRGIGNSLPAGKAEHNSIEDNIGDIEKLRQHLDVEQWDIFSWSFGAVFMAGYAFEHPERCGELISYAPYLGSDEDYGVFAKKAPAQAKSYFDYHGARDGKGVVSGVFNKAAAGDDKARFEAYWRAIVAMEDQPPSKEELYQTRTPKEWEDFFKIRYISAQHDLELFVSKNRFLEKVAKETELLCPVTLLYGENDVWSAPNPYTYKVFPNARKIEVSSAGHDVHGHAVQDCLRRILGGDKGTSPSSPSPR